MSQCACISTGQGCPARQAGCPAATTANMPR
ncbi:hypothetical protein EEJ42_47020 [Streptomyces botrytidirepellens]|uniref:Uncharacterized protein n=1 Tax=Streptomyces botrytidirepellens TaxID=2486417 RepID=A0A3M8SIJ5_9ACTN|nr:hypothetical protein EEJ42_47020 [Streptomyces botrytidirepellens]